jgi:hypothetical protein
MGFKCNFLLLTCADKTIYKLRSEKFPSDCLFLHVHFLPNINYWGLGYIPEKFLNFHVCKIKFCIHGSSKIFDTAAAATAPCNEAPEVVLRVTATGWNGLLIPFGCQPNQ